MTDPSPRPDVSFSVLLVGVSSVLLGGIPCEPFGAFHTLTESPFSHQLIREHSGPRCIAVDISAIGFGNYFLCKRRER